MVIPERCAWIIDLMKDNVDDAKRRYASVRLGEVLLWPGGVTA